ncbi:MAG: TonB-dependent receptor [Mucilaginibacter polytrichastri]|nr:TonB-dependent receptor [Mucilaginibacter polytrichastri]
MKKTQVKKALMTFAICGAGLPFSPLIFAQSDTLNRHKLDEVVIRERQWSKQRLSPVPVQILDSALLRKINSLNVADALRYFSGVQLKDYGGVGGLKTLNVRSLGTEHTAVFYDGVQLGNAQNGQIDLGRFSLENISAIELFNGQNTDLLQPARAYASSSSLYLQTQKPRFTADKNFRLRLQAKSGSFGLINPALAFDYRLNDKLSLRVSTEMTRANGRYRFRYTGGNYDTTAIRNNSDIQAYRAEAALFGRPDSSSEWSARIYHYASQRGLPRAIVSNRFDATQRLWDDNTFVQAAYRRAVSERYALLVSGKFSNDYSRYLDPEFLGTDGALNNRYKQREAYFSLANTYTLRPWWTLALSGDYQFNSLDANLYRFAFPRRNTVLASFSSAWNFPRFSAQAGVLSHTVLENTRELEAGSNQQKFTPSLSFSWQPFSPPNFRVRGFYKSAFRMPTFNDLYYTFVGNTFLRPESAQQVDLGLTWSKAFGGVFRTLDIQTDAYYNAVKDKIVAVPGANLFRWTMLNLDRVQIKGIDASIRASAKIGSETGISGGLNYTFQQATDASADSYAKGQQIPYTPKHSGAVILAADYRKLGLSYSFIYTGERYSQRANIAANYVEPWYTHDVSLRYKFGSKVPLRFTAEINNLLNQYYDVVLNFPMPGRNYRFTLACTI